MPLICHLYGNKTQCKFEGYILQYENERNKKVHLDNLAE